MQTRDGVLPSDPRSSRNETGTRVLVARYTAILGQLLAAIAARHVVAAAAAAPPIRREEIRPHHLSPIWRSRRKNDSELWSSGTGEKLQNDTRRVCEELEGGGGEGRGGVGGQALLLSVVSVVLVVVLVVVSEVVEDVVLVAMLKKVMKVVVVVE
ncbi:unnamed protein product [Lampetra fluviatilis]